MSRNTIVAIALLAGTVLAFPFQKQNADKQGHPDQPPPRFKRTYEQDKVIGPGVGGHASAPGRAPAQRSSSDDMHEAGLLDIKIRFEEVPLIQEKTFFGGPAKDHILESGGAGVAL